MRLRRGVELSSIHDGLRATISQWSAGCTQLVVAAVSFVAFVVLTSAHYISNDGPVLYFALIAGSAVAGAVLVGTGRRAQIGRAHV